ncbi:hypothetical protein Tco_0913743, partial [Tanacetum coccineum]
EVPHFKDTLIQQMGFVKKSIAERTRYKREYESMVNERQLQTQEGKVDMVKALDVNLAVTESSGTESVNQYESDSSGNDTFIDDANIKPTYDEEPMAEDFQDSPDDEEDTRSSEEYLNDLEEEYQEKALLAIS